MAVTLTAMLAIIGSSFVLVTRLERQTVRSFATVQGMDQIEDYVIRKIQSTIAGDVVTQNQPSAGPYDPVSRLRSAVVGGAPLNYDPFDAPGLKDPWLAPIEPVAVWDSVGNKWQTIGWQYTSDAFASNPQAIDLLGALDPKVVADADGDGIPDSRWQSLNGLQALDGKDVFVAVRIIDNCGMLNLNTAVRMYEAISNTSNQPVPDTYGWLPTQLNLLALFQSALPPDPKAFPYNPYGTTFTGQPMPTPGDDEVWLLRTRLTNMTLPPPTGYGVNLSEVMTYYADWLLRFYEVPQSHAWTLPLPPPSQAPADLGRYARLFDINDELALRNRFLLKSASTSRIEAADTLTVTTGHTDTQGLWYVLGDEPGDVNNDGVISRRLWQPFTDARTWANTLFGTPAEPRFDIRHLLTTYSFDRTVRPMPQAELDTRADPVAPTRRLLGPMRQVDINAAVADLLKPLADPAHMRGASKLVHALRYVFAPDPKADDLAVQYVANLRDYLDADSDVTVFIKDALGTGIPSTTICGYERQPFISEVVVRLATDGSNNTTVSTTAVELCNPYPAEIVLDGWKLSGGGIVEMDLTGVVPPARTWESDAKWRPGRLIIFKTGAPVLSPSTEYQPNTTLPWPDGVRQWANDAFVFSRDSTEPLKIYRPAPGVPITGRVLVDHVEMAPADGSPGLYYVLGKDSNGSDATLPPANQSYDYSIKRGVDCWRFARNQFKASSGPSGSNVSQLGLWYTKINANDTNGAGAALQVADRIPVGSPDTIVFGWMEVGRPVFIGNSAQGASPEQSLTDIVRTKLVSLPSPTNIEEGMVRFNMGDPETNPTKNRARKLFEVMGFFARDDDGYNNEAGTSADKNTESLMECRIPGRINVNTAPEAVLRAVFPALSEPTPDPSVVLTASEWAECQRRMAEWFAKAVVYIRNDGNGPFRGLDDFVRRLDAFANPTVGTQPVIPELPQQAGVMRFAQMAKRAIEVVKNVTTTVRNVGDWQMTGDFEDRDWLFGRMANLLTVRSDTFTAYILIRIQSQANPNEVSERRLMAIFDRSNVFLPPVMARNGQNDSLDPLSGTDPDERDRLYVTPRVVAVQPVPDVN